MAKREKMPYLYKKIYDFAKNYEKNLYVIDNSLDKNFDKKFDRGFNNLTKNLASSFRLDKNDTRIVFKELEGYGRVKRINQRKVRIR